MVHDASPRDPDALLDRAGVTGDRRVDQHFLIDDRVLDRIATYARERLPQSPTILEIGAGTGALTDRLLAIASTVYAVERDRQLVGFLRREFADEIANNQLDVIEGDALEVSLPVVDGVVANLPYGISSEIIFRLLEQPCPMVLMVQREFADRLCAAPNTSEYGRLTVTAGHRARSTILEIVPPTAFQPAPPVESAIVAMIPSEPTYRVSNEEQFHALVRAVFTQRRKTMRNAIANTTHISGIEAVEAVLHAIPDDWLGRRPGEFRPDEFAELAQIVDEVDTA